MNKNKMFSMLLVIAMVMSLFVVPANASAENKEDETKNVVYTIDLNSVDEATWKAAARPVRFIIGDEVYSVGVDNSDLGNAVVCDWPVYADGVKTNRTMGITYIPVRKCVNALEPTGIFNIEWFSEDGGYAILTCGRGEIKLRAGEAYAEVVVTGEKLGDTSAYVMPDGKTPAPIILNRQGRLYVSARALANLIMEAPDLQWDRTTLNITGTLIGKKAEDKDWVGVKQNFGVRYLSELKDLPAIAAAITETNAKVAPGEHDLAIRPADAYGTQHIYLQRHVHDYPNGFDAEPRYEYCIRGLGDYVGWHDEETPNNDYLKIIKAILDELISNSEDIDAIYKIVEDADKDKTTTPDKVELNTVVVEWGYERGYGIKDLKIYNKLS